jgi:DtxR family Mn-dependent transcriptional regulator
MNYSVAEENYIKSVYHLQQQFNRVSTNHLAEALQTQPASVTDMMKKLLNKKLVHYEPYRGVKLSSNGRKVALQIIRKHRLWEYFLVHTLGFGWEEVHEVAEQLEHVNSPKLIEHLDRFLGHPPFDPHGDPIPDQQGKITFRERLPLLDQPIGQLLEITGVGNESPSLLEMLKHHQIRLGIRLKMLRKFSFDGSVEVVIETAQPVIISKALADCLLVKWISYE